MNIFITTILLHNSHDINDMMRKQSIKYTPIIFDKHLIRKKSKTIGFRFYYTIYLRIYLFIPVYISFLKIRSFK